MADLHSNKYIPERVTYTAIVLDESDLIRHMSTTQRLSHGTIVTRKSRIKIFYNWLKENDLKWNPDTVERFFYYLQKVKHLSGTSLNTYIIALRTFEKYLFSRGMAEMAMMGFKRYREEDPDIEPLSVEEIRLLKNYCLQHSPDPLEQSQKDLTAFLIDTGARVEDGQAFECKSVDVIGTQIAYVQLKTGVKRILHVEGPLLDILKKRIENKTSGSLVFTNSVGRKIHYPDYYQWLKKTAARVGIVKRVSPHVLRHSYGQNFYDLTRDAKLLQDLFKHKSIESTNRYIRNSQEMLKTAQRIHPHLSGSVDPKERVNLLEKDLFKHGLEKDMQFDPILVKQAINNFMIALYGSIKPADALNLP